LETDVDPVHGGQISHARAISISPGGWVAVVGDPGADGDVHGGGAVAIREWTNGVPSGSWSEPQVVRGLSEGEQFGQVVAATSEHVLVGVSGFADGLVDCLKRSEAGAWYRYQTITPPAGWRFSLYRSIATDGLWAAIPMAADGTGHAAVGLWQWDGESWTYEQAIELGEASGVSLDMDTQQLVVGWHEADGDSVNEGRINVY
jgi:hypothetical protein